jgi:hypothetical protein
MPLCPHCSQEHPPGSGFCPNTGLPLTALVPAPSAVPAPVAPAGAVRHHYPLAIEQAGFGTAFGLLMKTLPYALVRFGVLMAASIVTIIAWVIALGGGAYLATKVAPAVGWIWIIAWLIAFGFFWRLFFRYFLYLIKCGHIVVLTELITKGTIANGQEGMFAYGRRIVTERFGEVSVLFGVGLLVRGVVNAFNRTLDFIGSLLPVEGLQQLLNLVKAVIRAATTYIDETLFSYGLAREERNPWASARDGVVYYAQNAKEILKTAAGIVLLDFLFSFAVWLVMLGPAFALSRALPQSMFFVTLAGWVIAVLFASSFRTAFLKPLFLIMVMVKFHVLVRGQAINLEWEQRLETVSAKFRELRDKVMGVAHA